MKRKIRHALVQYMVVEEGKTRFETAFRNQIVDIPDDQVDRLDELGATVAPDESLERPGTMSNLPETASDAEIISWVMGASDDEVEALVRSRPVMAGRIEAAHASVKERFQEQNLHLGGLLEIADELLAEQADEEAATAAALAADLIGDTPAPVVELTPEAADTIVDGNAKSVVDYISENPADALLLVEAEHRRSAARKEDVRVSIVKAAEAAVGFTN